MHPLIVVDFFKGQRRHFSRNKVMCGTAGAPWLPSSSSLTKLAPNCHNILQSFYGAPCKPYCSGSDRLGGGGGAACLPFF